MLIIGLGNPDRGDDAAGILVARRLAEQGFQAIEHRGAMLDLIEIWAATDCAVVVDAVVSGAAPGAIHVWDARISASQDHVFRSSTHNFALVDVIELARALDRLPKKLTVYGIEAAQFKAGAPPSSQVVAGIERAVTSISAPKETVSNR